VIVGRDRELAELARVARTPGAALVLRGDIGSGKTTLLRVAVAGLPVLHVSGVPGERGLLLGGLRQLGAFDTGAALLERLAAFPSVVVVDDAHHLDVDSQLALAYAARRLGATGSTMLFSATHEGFADHGLDELQLGGLDRADAARLVAPTDQDAILDAAQGNPLALRELTGPLSVTEAGRRVFAARLDALDDDTRTLLLVAASDPACETSLVLEAARRLGVDASALDRAERAHLVRAGETIEFRHPLLRAVVHQGATLAERTAARGALAEHPVALQEQATASLRAGRLALAAAEASGGLRFAERLGDTASAAYHRGVLACVAAAEGRETECRALAASVFAHATPLGLELHGDLGTAALGDLELVLGRPEEALAHLTELAGRETFVAEWTAPSLVEAAVRAGRRDVAEHGVHTLVSRADNGAADQALVARCRALLDESSDRFETALRLHEAAGATFAAARTRLLYGETLRRNRRRIDARSHLRAAHESFLRLGATAWAERAATELRGSGQTAQRGNAARLDQLTPQELQVAQLVAAGSTNKQVAAQLFLSPRTIDFHLRNVFAKLGITSRIQLAWFCLPEAA